MSSKNYFEKVANNWDEMRSGFFPESVRQRALEQIDFRPGITIADVGAGTGFLTEGLITYPVEIIALDESEKMLTVMRQKFKAATNIRYQVAESEGLQLADQSVDYALANMYLHHVERPPQAISELFRILKPGGKLIITDLDKHDNEFLRIEQHDRWLGFEREDIVTWFREAGFREVSIDCVNASCCADSTNSDAKADVNIFIAVGEK